MISLRFLEAGFERSDEPAENEARYLGGLLEWLAQNDGLTDQELCKFALLQAIEDPLLEHPQFRMNAEFERVRSFVRGQKLVRTGVQTGDRPAVEDGLALLRKAM